MQNKVKEGRFSCSNVKVNLMAQSTTRDREGYYKVIFLRRFNSPGCQLGMRPNDSLNYLMLK